MIRLALAIGFMAVFGFVAYALVLLLTKAMKEKDNKDNN
ncbi:MAG: hypothetical protein K0R51_23 [Cytophagaceae bacterium]|jgi:hypothetical protein|nr:hypothetical protein [Cytophagaceae bacterium]